jgi:dTDP-4-amino-4,6-dideoxygalactose transaminase
MTLDPAPREWRVPLADVKLEPDAIAAVASVLNSGWLSSGPLVERFEAEFAAYVGCRHAVACASGTAAIELSYDALGIGSGDEVIMPSLNFVAAANLAARRGAHPVLADVAAEDDLTIDPASLRGLVTARTRAVVAMHYGGYPCRSEVFDLAEAAGIPVIEDAAHAAGARSDRGNCGSLGAVGCFSFYANKNLPLGEGGMLTTNDDRIAARARSLRSHGMTTTTWQRRHARRASYDVTAPGTNARLDEPRAALGSALLTRLDEVNLKRAEVVAAYRDRLTAVDRVRPAFPDRTRREQAAHHLFCVVLEHGVDRDGVRAALADAGVQTSVHYTPIHRLTAFAEHASLSLPHTDSVAGRLITLPLHARLGSSDITLVVDALRASV